MPERQPTGQFIVECFACGWRGLRKADSHVMVAPALAWLEFPCKECGSHSFYVERPYLTGGKRGFASMLPSRHAQIARLGGKSAVNRHSFTRSEAIANGRKGGFEVLKRYGVEHFRRIGREARKGVGRA